ncbi:MAG: chorismate synthase [Chloroflexi bacterium]|nr:chorismate synthase [Chloroflexota bacterium]
MGNSFGTIFRVTSFGESHGRCVGVVVDGCPAGLPLTEADVQKDVDRRRPGITGTTKRAEEDKVEILSGVFNGFTTGAPLAMLAWNKDMDSSAYEAMRSLPRPGHADYTAYVKYGGFNDYRGGGRFSGRITAGLVMAGAAARKLLGLSGIEVLAHTVQIGTVQARQVPVNDIKKNIESDPLRCADPEASGRMMKLIEAVAREGDSIGGVIECLSLGVPAGLGEPVFDTLDGTLAKAMLAIPAVKGVEFGAGFAAAGRKGSENNDPFVIENGKILTATNNAGGILGGISSGMPLVFRAAVKPTASIAAAQDTVDLRTMQKAGTRVRGRHDSCIVPRAVPVVEAMTAATLCDFMMRARLIPGVLK